ncbi:MAG: FkbM family methyltransferase [Hyphomicrobiales bacterium]|nr:FkbM family methyltransferase [Hyphomicrobiales bacterium]
MLRSIQNDLTSFGRYAPKGMTAGILDLTRRCPHSWAGARRAFILRGLAVKALAGRPLDVEALGAKMRLYPYNNTCEKRILFTPQFFDPEELSLVEAHLRDDTIFVDVGANIGGYTLFAASRAGQRARILAVEPNPIVFERLIYNIRQNPFGSVKAIDCAIADRDGEITLFLDPANQGETSIRISDSGGDYLRVPSKSLKNVLSEEDYPRVDILKIDVEGAEDVVLEPFFREAPRSLWPRLLICAHSQARWSSDLNRQLLDYGYREVLRTRNNIAWELA